MNAHAHHLTRDQVIALLEERDELRETIRQLQEALSPSIPLPRRWRLTRTEEALLLALRSASPGLLHKERAMLALYGTWEDAPEIKIVDVLICKVRRKLMLAQERVSIETFWGRGWQMTAEGCRQFDAAVAAYRGSFPEAGALARVA